MGPKELIPTILVFGALLSLIVSSAKYTMKRDRMRALQTAREEMAGLVAR